MRAFLLAALLASGCASRPLEPDGGAGDGSLNQAIQPSYIAR